MIREAPRERFAQFYHDWYTPARSVVVVTGDVEPAAVAKLIEERFGSFVQPADAPADPAVAPMADRGLDAMLVSDPGLRTSISLNTVLPYDHRKDSLAKERDQLLEMLASAMLSRRLDRIALSPGAPFANAGAGVSELPPAARIATVRLVTTPETWTAALAAGEQELRRALEYGFSDAELAEQLAIFRSGYTASAASASTRETPDLAAQLVNAIDDDGVFTTPANDLAVFDELTKGLRPADTDQALRAIWAGREPQIFLAGPIQLADPKAAILAAYAASHAVAVAPPAAVATAEFAYSSFGSPPAWPRPRRSRGLGITRVTFGNGVVLDLKRTPFEADTVHVAVRFGSGRIGLPPYAAGPRPPGRAWLRRWWARQAGYRGDLADPGVQACRYRPRGRRERRQPAGPDHPCRPAAAARPAGGLRHRPGLPAGGIGALPCLARVGLCPAGGRARGCPSRSGGAAAARRRPALRHAAEGGGGAAYAERAARMARPMLQHGPMQIVIVGDIDPAAAIAEVGRTFGALPARGTVAAAVPPHLTIPAEAEPVRFTHRGPEGQGLALVYWPTTGRGDAKAAVGLDLVADILSDRLLREVRQHEGATYSPEASSDMSLVLPGYGTIGAAVDVRAQDAERIVRLMADVGTAMQAGGITQDEFDRALQPRLAQVKTAQQNNDYWLYNVMVGMEQYPQLLNEARTVIADLESQTLASVQTLASRYLTPDRALPILVVPAADSASTSSQAADAVNAAPPVKP